MVKVLFANQKKERNQKLQFQIQDNHSKFSKLANVMIYKNVFMILQFKVFHIKGDAFKSFVRTSKCEVSGFHLRAMQRFKETTIDFS